MALDSIVLNFADTFDGEMNFPNGVIKIGNEQLKPYHMLFGALGSCFYATFLEIVKKKRLSFTGATLTITGKKREQIPTTLAEVVIDLEIKGTTEYEQFTKCVNLGAQYCSIHETIKQVADIKFNIHFS